MGDGISVFILSVVVAVFRTITIVLDTVIEYLHYVRLYASNNFISSSR